MSKPRWGEQLFVCSLAMHTHTSSLVKSLFRSFAHVFTGLFVFLLLSLRILYTFWIQIVCHVHDLQISSPGL